LAMRHWRIRLMRHASLLKASYREAGRKILVKKRCKDTLGLPAPERIRSIGKTSHGSQRRGMEGFPPAGHHLTIDDWKSMRFEGDVKLCKRSIIGDTQGIYA